MADGNGSEQLNLSVRQIAVIVSATLVFASVVALGGIKLIISMAPWEKSSDATRAEYELRERLNKDEGLITTNQQALANQLKTQQDEIKEEHDDMKILTSTVVQLKQQMEDAHHHREMNMKDREIKETKTAVRAKTIALKRERKHGDKVAKGLTDLFVKETPKVEAVAGPPTHPMSNPVETK